MVEESSLQTTDRASNMMEDIRAPETSRVTHIEVLQSACTALQVELERLQKQKTEFSKQHNDMVSHPCFSFSAIPVLMFV